MTHGFGLLVFLRAQAPHGPGQEQTPSALRAAGVIARLTAAGVSLVDYGDLPLVRCRLDRTEVRRLGRHRV